MKTLLVLLIFGTGLLSGGVRAELPRGVYGLHNIEEARAEAVEKGKALAYMIMDSNST